MNFNTNTRNCEVWLTPPDLLARLGKFDLDPCSPKDRPWDTANEHYTIDDDGLIMPWTGRVWCNPPYGRQLIHWLNKCALHENVIALVFARTDTRAFQQFVFPMAHSMLFLEKRIAFHRPDGSQGDKANGPSVLISYNPENTLSLADSGLSGHLIELSPAVIIVQSETRTWQLIIGEVLIEEGQPIHLSEIYASVCIKAPTKVRNNRHYKAKVRQVLQQHFQRTSKGTYTS